MSPTDPTRKRGANRPAFEIVAIASSVGGLTALSRVLSSLPETFAAAVVAVQHLDPRHRSLLAEIIGRRSPLPVRPAADLPFESVAASYGKRAIAVVLTGSGRDGSIGVSAIKQRGGTVIAQDEATSEFYGMQSAAIRTGVVDFVMSLDEIAPALRTLVNGEIRD